MNLVIPMEVEWTTREGTHVKEQAETEVVNAHGAVLRLKTRYPVSPELILRNPHTGQSAPATAVWRASKAGVTVRLAVGLKTPTETLWGVSIPPLPGRRSR